jgi:hypothetical protein
VAIDDSSRVAYAEELDDERKETCVAFVLRAPRLRLPGHRRRGST